ncbi:MAG: DEAD/DEAH box helicase [Opitutae bacterium]|nr:DEAD/DEAH box helicase [Opitutae bacterium]
MQTNSNRFGERISLPDSWQRKALASLRDGKDVVLHAPTGAGKTFVFEQLLESGWKGRAVYTVPTRALANDKFREWKARGWDVGLVTGDLRYRENSRVIVATLETQRGSMTEDLAPDLLVVDEYQLLGDEQRGPGYEVTLAVAPNRVRLLLMSGSVANPQEVTDWLAGHGRDVVLVSELRRPVPLEEVFAEALLKKPFGGRKVRGHWPKLVAGVLGAGLGPFLLFAPRRKAAEDLARQLAAELPEVEPLELTSQQKGVAGKELSSLLRRRVAYHHSGLDYLKRAGVIEPLAKAGQLQVVVATTGLGAGVNFSMRSVLVTDREYRVDDGLFLLRPDELLQMFGRAGRRGLDDRGFVVLAPKQGRLADARPLKLKRSRTLDWPALLRAMKSASKRGEDHTEAARWLANRLFSEEQVRLGFKSALGHFASKVPEVRQPTEGEGHDAERDRVIEMRNSSGLWERRGGQCQARLGEALVLSKGEWVQALSLPETLSKVRVGNPCRFGLKKRPVYGRELPIAVYEEGSDGERVVLIKSFRKKLREAVAAEQPRAKKKFSRKTWRRNGLEDIFRDLLPTISQGGKPEEYVDRGKVLRVRLRYEDARVLAWRDARGKILLNPPLRKTTRVFDSPFREEESKGRQNLAELSTVEAWRELGLVDDQALPTKRGEIFSFFSRGEGLAVAAALEDLDYPVDELAYDLANLRAGHRFRSLAKSESRLGLVCRQAFGFKDCPGYLKGGLPLEYGEGATEVLSDRRAFLDESEDLKAGDLERVSVEWKSLLALIARGPTLEDERWNELQAQARSLIGTESKVEELPVLPEMPSRQRERFERSLPKNYG